MKDRDRFKEIVRFAVNGGVSFAVDYGVMIALTEWCGWNYLWAAGVSFTLSVVVNYILCKCWVFEGAQKQGAKAMTLFIGSSVVGLGLNQALMYGMVELIGLNYMVAKIVATAIVMVWNYVMKRKAIYMDGGQAA